MTVVRARSVPRLRHGAGFWTVAAAFVLAMSFSGVPTPLYAVYAERDGFSSLVITVAFCVYSVAVAASLFLVGHSSDWLGRRRTLVPALMLTALADLVFLAWPHLGGVLLGRVLAGLAVGVISATATAYLAELHAAHRPEASPVHGRTIAGVAAYSAPGLGALVCAVIAQVAPRPLTTPYVVFGVLLVCGAVVVALVPETRPAARPRPPYRPQRVAVPPHARAAFFAAAVVGAAVTYASAGLFASLSPSVTRELGHSSLIVGTIAFSLLLGAGAAMQAIAAHWRLHRVLRVGMPVLAVGMVLVAVSIELPTPSFALFAAGGAVVGAGCGLLVRGGMGVMAAIAPPDRRAEVMAGFFLTGYVGTAVGVVGSGVVSRVADLRVAFLVFAAAVLLTMVVSARVLLGVADPEA